MSINLTIIFYVLIVIAMIAFILVQRSPGATAGSAFGGGASSTVFGAKGSGNFLTKSTMMLAFLFFAISLFMAVQAKKEFSAVNSGEVDLGVVGKLEDNNSDLPEMAPVEPVVDTMDLPVLDSEVVNAETAVKDAVENAGEKVESAVKNAAQELDTGAEAKVEDAVKQAANQLKTEAEAVINPENSSKEDDSGQ